jgi:hypothetical protein
MAVARRTVESGVGERAPTAPALPTCALLLLAALSACITAQGGYYAAGQVIAGGLLAAALVSAHRSAPLSGPDFRLAPVMAAGALAAWALVDARIAGGQALPVVALLGAFVAVLLVCRRVPAANRDALALALGGIGVLVALSGWAGVAWRLDPLALEDQELWRAATTLTYANAAAGVLVPLALLALGRQLTVRRSPTGATVSCLLLAGAGATLSRGGAVALLAGLICLAAVLGVRRTVGALAGPAFGAVVAMAALAPSMPAGAAPRPALAVLGLAAGVALAAAFERAPTGARHGAVALGLVAVAAVVALGPFDSVRDTRLSLASADRRAETSAALRLVADRPLTGTGPGRATLFFDGADGQALFARYVHNEYLQVSAELGLIGLAFSAALLIALARTVRAGRASAPSLGLWAGAAAGLVALATHSAFDFLWHVPAIPLAGALLAGLTFSATTTKEQAA